MLDYGGNTSDQFCACSNWLDAERVEWVVFNLPKIVETACAAAP